MPGITKIDGKPIRKDTHIPMRADICCNPLGVINRLNVAQLIENEINFISQHIRYWMEEMDDPEDQYNLAYDFVHRVDERSGRALQHTKSLCKNKKELKDLMQQFIDHGFYIQQQPYWINTNVFDLAKLYDHFNITEKYQTDHVKTPLILGEVYYIRLHHDPQNKLSARSSGNNNYQNLPTKTTDMKNSTGLTGNTPIRLG